MPDSRNAAGEADNPLTIALVVDSVGNRGNGTSNSALQYAKELERQGHHVRLVGVGAPDYPVEVHHLPFVSWLAAKQQMQFAQPDDVVFRRAFEDVDAVHIYMPFKFGRRALAIARSMGIPVTAGFHLQPENVTYSAGPLRYIPGIPSLIYYLFDFWLYRHVGHIHTPSQMIARQLRAHGYHARLHVISNGYSSRFHPAQAESNNEEDDECDQHSRTSADIRTLDGGISERHNSDLAGVDKDDSAEIVVQDSHGTRPMFSKRRVSLAAAPEVQDSHGSQRAFRIIASGRLTHEKDHETLIRAIALSKHASQIDLTICGTGPLQFRLRRLARRLLPRPAHIGFHANEDMPNLLRQADLLVHPSIVDIESLSVLEGIASGLVPVIADSPLSAASQFALTDSSVSPARNAKALARRIDWWIEHPQERAQWGPRYAQEAREKYALPQCVRQFVVMEREAIADARRQ
ncbi:glycosyltransferase [Bifidobacterium sp. ESL0745]|uniref:glycosyltransferase n=1 Tax=Bifidobacterium sp. ESL0745 TaxID=2983226 RepID=UPI0023F9EF55|nr:glycosyltransferase [Bifidobacterium sp. ESL0745]MDF7664858.1 glycosyltransferase [Bifidobacterium sp. ESL0745]